MRYKMLFWSHAGILTGVSHVPLFLPLRKSKILSNSLEIKALIFKNADAQSIDFLSEDAGSLASEIL